MNVCRICLEEENCNDPIIVRCDCKGCSIHNSCLKKWILKKGNIKCEICKKNFTGIDVTYENKEMGEFWKTVYPFYNSLMVMFSTLNFLVLMGNNKNKKNMLDTLNISFLMIFINLSNSDYLKNKTVSIKEIGFKKINENNIV